MKNSEVSDGTERVTANADAYRGPIHNDSGDWSKSDHQITPHEETSPAEQAPHQVIELATRMSTQDDERVKKAWAKSL